MPDISKLLANYTEIKQELLDGMPFLTPPLFELAAAGKIIFANLGAVNEYPVEEISIPLVWTDRWADIPDLARQLIESGLELHDSVLLAHTRGAKLLVISKAWNQTLGNTVHTLSNNSYMAKIYTAFTRIPENATT